MRLFGLQITRAKSAVTPIRGTPWFGQIIEGFGGAWQRNIVCEPLQNILAFSAVYACIALISGDIAKLRVKSMRRDRAARIWTEDEAGLPVLDRPNLYQTLGQFLENWVSSKLLHGNTYVLLERERNAGVTAMYVLDPRTVVPLVAPDGDVYYQLGHDDLNGVVESNPDISEARGRMVVHRNQMIHDRAVTLWHPLCGVSPIYACAASATQGIRIQNNSEAFFKNLSRPSGMLTTPHNLPDETIQRLKDEFEKRFSGQNLGRLFVGGDGLKFEPMTMPAHDAQLIEQLKWTVEDVARCFRVPLHMLAMSGAGPTYSNAENYTLSYYSQTLQSLIEAIEALLNKGLGLPRDRRTEFDLDGLLRMDQVSRADANAKAINAGYLAPNEARRRENLPPVDGGDTPYLQQQMFSLQQLSERTPPQDAPVIPSKSAGLIWKKDTRYTKGAITVHAGRAWRAAVNTQGGEPGDGAMWEDIS